MGNEKPLSFKGGKDRQVNAELGTSYRVSEIPFLDSYTSKKDSTSNKELTTSYKKRELIRSLSILSKNRV
jgi:hypothetical protein